MRISIEEKLTYVDSNGLLFKHGGKYFRAFTASQQKNFIDPIMNCGMVEELVRKELLVPTWITEHELDGYAVVLEHQALEPVVYPYEWSFSMVKDAALAFLELAEIAHRYGYYLKDCHPFNFVFYNCKPRWVDFGSFEKCNEEFSGFFAAQEFIKQYYYPLRLWSSTNEFLGRAVYGIMSSYQYLTIIDFLKIRHSWLTMISEKALCKYGRLLEMYYNLFGINVDGIGLRRKSERMTIIAKMIKKFVIPPTEKQFKKWTRHIEAIRMPVRRSQWQDYHDGIDKEISPRFRQIMEIIKELKCSSVTELAGNAGALSLLLHEKQICKRIICTDYDANAIDKLYLQIKERQVKGILPAVVNIMLPLVTTYGPPPQERFKSDAVLALAVTHHLILSQKFNIRDIFHAVADYSTKYVFIEFMPLGLYDGKTGTPVPEWYNVIWFRDEFRQCFEIVQEQQLEENRILFVGKLKNNLQE